MDTETRELWLLLAARRLGVLEAVAMRTGTPEGVARECDIDERAARLLVGALAERGFLTELDGEYQPRNRLLGFLTKTDLHSIGRLPDALDAMEAWLALPGTARGGDRPDGDHATRNELGREAAADATRVRGAVHAALREAPDARRVCCVGDGPGMHAREFATVGRDVTLVDTPERVDAARPQLDGREGPPVTLVAGDPADDLPASDLVFGADLLGRHRPERVPDLLGAVTDALGDDGTLVLVEPLLGETPGAVLAAVEAYARRGGTVPDWPTLRGWLTDAGLRPDRVPLPGDDRALVVGRVVH